MALLKTISGIRGTIGGRSDKNLTPIDIVECVAGYGQWLLNKKLNNKVVVGRDGRISGQMVSQLAIHTLVGMGIDVIDLGLSTTPTVEMMVPYFEAGGGIIFTASHNPMEWNALKFLNDRGEFISAEDGIAILKMIENGNLEFAEVTSLGKVELHDGGYDYHIQKILEYPHVDVSSIQKANISVVVDCINSTGAHALPPLLDRLGVKYTLLHEDNFGYFAHNPEPLPTHLLDLSAAVVSQGADMGISIDPDVDRLALVCEDGSMFGEEYTLVACADYVLSKEVGNTVSNLSSTRALSDVTLKHGGQYMASAVGEVNVVNAMKSCQAVIGGEGNGGIIVPALHYGRDAMAGIAIFLSLYAQKALKMTELKSTYPQYVIIKDKLDLTSDLNLDTIFDTIRNTFANEKINDVDGLKIDFANGWVHMRKSNTEPIVRIYCEAGDEITAKDLISRVKACI